MSGKSKKWAERLDEVREKVANIPTSTNHVPANIAKELADLAKDAGFWKTCACGEQHEILHVDMDLSLGPWDSKLDHLGRLFTQYAKELFHVNTFKDPKEATERYLKNMAKIQAKIQERATQLLLAIKVGRLHQVPEVDIAKVPSFVMDERKNFNI